MSTHGLDHQDDAPKPATAPPYAGLDSRAVHAGREDLNEMGVHALPIDLSTAYPLPSIDEGGDAYEQMAGGGDLPAAGGAVYGRLWNPTVARFERGLAALEGAEKAVAFSTGMAAMTAAILAATVPGPARMNGQAAGSVKHIVAVRPLYGGSDHLLDSGMLGTEVTFCDADDVAGSMTAATALVVIETPANPTLELVDIAHVVRQAGAVPVLVDNTFATPVLQNPIALGARLVLHSATKYLGGHGDVMGGVIACDTESAEALRRIRAITGALLHPMAAYLLHRGLATLPIRMRAQQESAGRIAEWLGHQPGVEKVHYPGPAEDPRGLLGAQMRGPGAMLAISLAGGATAAAHLTSSTRLFTHAVSLGGVDSLIQNPANLTHRPVAPEARPGANVVRLSIGLENVEDLIADLDAALPQQHARLGASRSTSKSSARHQVEPGRR